VFIVQGKPREPEGIIKVVKNTRREALQAANELLKNGMAFVTIVADGRIYTVEEFAQSIR
jgi:ketosteroid isomerase-like protein